MATFWRIVKTDPPAPADFLPQGRMGLPPPPGRPPEFLDSWWNTISGYDSQDEAQRTARKFPRLGRYLARIELEPNSGVSWEKTGGAHHYDLRGDFAVAFEAVRAVVQLREEAR